MITALLVIGILVLLIVAHELGHFIVAKICRVRVDEFGVGYPPRAFSFGRWGGTEYTLNWIPFGGFVRLFGDEGEDQHGRGSLIDAARWKQALILVAGVCANAIVGWMLFTGALHSGIPRIVATAEPGQSVRLLVANVVPGSPAASAGIASGDEILGMIDAKGTSLDLLTPEAISDFVRDRGGTVITVSYVHAGATSTTNIIPAHAVIPDAAGRPALGVALALVSDQSLPWGQAAKEALTSTRNAFGTVAGSLWKMLKNAVQGALNLSDVIGPVGLVQVVGEASHNGLGNILALAGFISVNLAIINLIPIPALDGGRLVLLGIEAVRGRNAPRLAVQVLNMLGIALIALLMITVTYHDIVRLFA
jgi:regulator of sigma E protease